eukprot:52439-Eustigmatos_ZCMA.PRE.1
MEKEKQRMIEQARTDAEIGLSTKTKAIWADNQRSVLHAMLGLAMLNELGSFCPQRRGNPLLQCLYIPP